MDYDKRTYTIDNFTRTTVVDAEGWQCWVSSDTHAAQLTSPEDHDTPERKAKFEIVQVLLAGGANPVHNGLRNVKCYEDRELLSLQNTYIWAQWARRLVPHLQNLGYTQYPCFSDVRRAYPYTLSKYFTRPPVEEQPPSRLVK